MKENQQLRMEFFSAFTVPQFIQVYGLDLVTFECGFPGGEGGKQVCKQFKCGRKSMNRCQNWYEKESKLLATVFGVQ